MHRCEKRTVQHSNGWLTLYYRLPSHLSDYAHLTLRSIEVAAVTHVKPDAVITSADNCLGYVGESKHTHAHSLQASQCETVMCMIPGCVPLMCIAWPHLSTAMDPVQLC